MAALPMAAGDSPARTPVDKLSIDAHDEDVQIAAEALKNMRAITRHDPRHSSGESTSGHTSRQPSGSLSSSQRDFPTASHPTTPSLSIASSATSQSFDSFQQPPIPRSSTPSSLRSRSPAPSVLAASESNSHSSASAARDEYSSRFPFVNRALKAYDYGKNNSRVVKFGAEMVESSVKTISKPVIDRLPTAMVDRLGYGRQDSSDGMQIDSDSERGRKEFRKLVGGRSDSWQDGRSPSDSRASSSRRVPPEERMEVEETGAATSPRHSSSSQSRDRALSVAQNQLVNRSAWHSVLVEAGGISAAVSDESMRKLRYCLQCLQYATANLDNQIRILQAFIASVDSTVTGDPVPSNAMVSPEALRQYLEVKKNVVETVRQVVDVIGKYAGGALPEPAKATVKNLILALPGRWSSAVRDTGPGLGDSWANDEPTSPSMSASGRTNPRKRPHGNLSQSSSNLAGRISAGSSTASISGGLARSMPPPASTSEANGEGSGARAASGSPDMARTPGSGRKALLPPTAGAARTAAHRVLTLATESLHAVRGVTGVFKDTLDRAETWLDRLRYVGYRPGDPVASLPSVSSSVTLPPINSSPASLERQRQLRHQHNRQLERLAKSLPSIGPYGPYSSSPPVSRSPSPDFERHTPGGLPGRAMSSDSFPFDNPAPGWMSRSGSVPAMSSLSQPRAIPGARETRRSGSMLDLLQSPTGEGSLPPPSTPGSLAAERELEDVDEQDEDEEDGLEYRARKRPRLRKADGAGENAE